METDLEKNEELAEQMLPFLNLADSVLSLFDFEHAEKSLKDMREYASNLESSAIIGMALGHDPTNKIEIMKVKNNTFSAFMNLLKARKKQIEIEIKMKVTKDSHLETAKKLGFL